MPSREGVEIYLDNNATTPVDPRVAAAMAEAEMLGFANPASAHGAGRRARKLLEDAREGIAELLNLPLDDAGRGVIFTSGGTEANNLALQGLVRGSPGRVVISSIEHPTVDGPANALAERGYDVQRIRVGPDGVIDLEHGISLLTPETQLASLMLGNNETGVLQPISQFAAVCATLGIPVHTDAVQAVGKIPVNFRELGVSALSLSAHKFHGPRGMGALLVAPGVEPRPLMFGGFQQAAIRPGTESVALVVGLWSALRLWHAESRSRVEHLFGLQQRFESQLRAGCPELVINGATANRLPQTSNISFPGLDRQALLMALDLAGVACSTGSACASGSSEPSPVLRAMGLADAVVEGALRFSWSAQTEAWEIDETVGRILFVTNKLRRKNSA